MILLIYNPSNFFILSFYSKGPNNSILLIYFIENFEQINDNNFNIVFVTHTQHYQF